MKKIHWILLGVTMVVAIWFVYRTRDTEPRVNTAIDLNWRFIHEDPAGAEDPGFDDSRWRYVSIPHDWMIENPVDRSSPSGRAGGYYPGGIGWYRKSIDLNEYTNREQLYLLFEGVYMNADVYFNGTHLGMHEYGYSSFYFDVTSLARFDTLNVIAVRTDCSSLPVDRWYSGAGIYRHVRLIATSPLHIPVWGTAVSSVIDSAGNAEMTVSVELQNNGRKPQRFALRCDVVDAMGQLVAEGKTSRYLKPGERDTAITSYLIEKPLLWSPGSPSLYSVNCYLMERNRQVDQVRTYHGIRSIRFDPDLGFVLNGEKVILKGVCLHHDGGELGAAVPLESWKRRFVLLKELGVNALRLAHNPHAPEVLDLCDRMGFLVIDEMYDKWEQRWHPETDSYRFPENWETDLSGFIRRDRNHPSVVLWSLGNETGEQLSDPKKGVEIYSELKQLVNSIDPTREVTCALHPGDEDRGHEIPSSMMQVSRVVSYNYRSDSFRTWHEQYPGLVFLASETMPYGTRAPDDYGVIDYSSNSWNNMEEFVAGQFIWSGIDYLGESSGWPDRGFRNGLLETSGFIKPHAWYIASRYREDPMVKLTVKDSLLADSLNRVTGWQKKWMGAPLVDHWTFGRENDTMEVVVFTNCRSVELHLNGRLIRSLERNGFPDGVIRVPVPFEPGEIVASAFYRDNLGNTQSVSDTLVTAHDPYALAMDPDRRQVRPNSRDVVHITTRVVDSSGVLNPHSRHLVNYQLDGPGRIRVIDNGDLADHTEPGTASREVRKGKQLLILQAGSEPGDLIISASADGLKPSQVKIKSKE